MRNSLKIVLINALAFAAGVVLIEAGFRAFIEGHSDDAEFRATQPAPYRDAPYFSAEFIAESFRQPGGWRQIPGTNTILPHDFKGKYYTVENGVRRTTDVPSGATHHIYLFGGSTIYDSEVPDGYTIASYLQRRLIQAGYDHYAVVNYGVTSVNTVQQLERLELSNISPGDIVVFYDGVNDVLQGVLYGNPGKTIHGNDKSRPLHQKVLQRLSRKSVAMRYLLGRANANYKIANLAERVAHTRNRYAENLAQAERIATERGARFLHFLQPTLYSLARRGEYERRLLAFGLVPVQAEEAFLATYPELVAVVAQRAREGRADFDLTAAFDALPNPVYLDGWHVNHVGNDAIAEQMFAALRLTTLPHP